MGKMSDKSDSKKMQDTFQMRGTYDEMEILYMILQENSMLKRRVLDRMRALREESRERERKRTAQNAG